jgi:hypothetical protein
MTDHDYQSEEEQAADLIPNLPSEPIPAPYMVHVPTSEFSVVTQRQADIVAVESPYPFGDSAHKAMFSVSNPLAEPLTITGYVAELVATIDGQDVVLGTDTSATHRDPLRGYTHVRDGMFIFFSGPDSTLCIDSLGLAAMPVEVPGEHTVFIPFYLHSMDLAGSLAPLGIADADALAARNGQVEMRLTVQLAAGAPLTATHPVEIVAAGPEEEENDEAEDEAEDED